MRSFKSFIKYLLGFIIFGVLLIGAAVFGLLYLNTHMQDKKIDNISKSTQHHTSKVIAYNFEGPKGYDSVKLKDGTQFDKNNLVVGDSNFESKVKFSSNTVKKNKKITYVKKYKKSIFTDPTTYYYIKAIE